MMAIASTTSESKRLAYVIGNTNYQYLPGLRNPSNDARAVASSLEQVGFTLFGGEPRINLSNQALHEELISFSQSVPTDSVALFYYAGHGFQWNDHNFLAGVDTPTTLQPSNTDSRSIEMVQIPQETRNNSNQLPIFRVDELSAYLNASASVLNIIILDACRNNPFPPGSNFGTSLARTDAPSRTLISYSTQPGNVALDGIGNNSPYTDALVEAISAPNATVLEVFNKTGLQVQEQTRGVQVPWISLSPIPSRLAFSNLFNQDDIANLSSQEIPDSVIDMQTPLAQLFTAWRQLDIDLYEAQWSDDAFQVAGKIQRNKSGILTQRRQLFSQLSHVTVASTDFVFSHRERNIAMFRNTYTMRFQFHSGRVIEENNISESYTVVFNSEQDRWLIKENFDYLDPSS
ncbi:MAG: caspase family protein [Cyanothece sp. SIO2G6]|nr:caspase family protein [Cyanothece sp. SIO2G6]